jgi:hypothetical protein
MFIANISCYIYTYIIVNNINVFVIAGTDPSEK